MMKLVEGRLFQNYLYITRIQNCLFFLLHAYRDDVRCENLTFWLFQNYVKWDVMSNNMKMNGDMRN